MYVIFIYDQYIENLSPVTTVCSETININTNISSVDINIIQIIVSHKPLYVGQASIMITASKFVINVLIFLGCQKNVESFKMIFYFIYLFFRTGIVGPPQLMDPSSNNLPLAFNMSKNKPPLLRYEDASTKGMY